VKKFVPGPGANPPVQWRELLNELLPAASVAFMVLVPTAKDLAAAKSRSEAKPVRRLAVMKVSFFVTGIFIGVAFGSQFKLVKLVKLDMLTALLASEIKEFFTQNSRAAGKFLGHGLSAELNPGRF
jgi:hypothetical protein